jgi:hypothetical protein
VWAAVAAAPAAAAPAASDAPPVGDPPTLEAILGAARAGPLSPWTLTSVPIDDARNPQGLDVALLDRAELAIVFGQIAPGRVSAPNPGLSFRVVAQFSDEQLGDRGWTNADVAYRAVSQLLFLRGNVISVDTTPGSAPADTVIAVADTGMNTAGAVEVFGDVEVVEAEQVIVGVDALLRLGESYLRFLDEVEAADAGTVASVPTLGTADVEPVSSDDVTATTTS